MTEQIIPCSRSKSITLRASIKTYVILLRRSDSNSRPNVRPIADVPDHRVSKKQTNEGVSNVRTVTCQAYTQTRAMNSHISHVINACSYHLRNINHISRCLPTTTKEGVINALITSRLDYCKSRLYNTSANNIYRVFNGCTMRLLGIFCVVPELTGPRHFYANCIGYQSRVGFSTRFYSSATR